MVSVSPKTTATVSRPLSSSQDPYLSALSDPDEDSESFRSTGIVLTSVQDQNSNGGGGDGVQNATSSSSPSHAPQGNGYLNLLSPPTDIHSNWSSRRSSISDIFLDSDTVIPGSELYDPLHALDSSSHALSNASEEDHRIWPKELASPPQVVNSRQLLSPDMSALASPSRSAPVIPRFDSPEVQVPQNPNGLQHMPPLDTDLAKDTLNVHSDPDSSMSRSPIVRIEPVSRGDSPERDTTPPGRRPYQSPTHLSPGGFDDESFDQNEETDYISSNFSYSGNSVTRANDGSWIPSSSTGQSGVDPSSRSTEYVASPSEAVKQRRQDDKNIDISSWSASVSAASYGAADVTRLRRRRSRSGGKGRSKSTGDQPLQVDYFTFRSDHIPGPNQLVHESSDDEECGSEASIPSLDTPISGEDPSPRTQPENSSAAMVQFELAAKDFDELSRRATWGTHTVSDAEANSIVSGGAMRDLSLDNEKGKKPETRGSLFRRLHMGHVPSPLKRQRSEVSAIQPSNDSANRNVDKGKRDSTSSRRPSISQSLGIGRHSRSPSLSTGGAVVAMTKQMAAVGGRDSLQPASPSLAAANPLKGRGRSRSELPRPSNSGLVGLMASHGGPPVAAIACRVKPEDSQTNDNRKDSGDADADAYADDGNDVEARDGKGLVMDFPKPTPPPIPTFEGFKAQIMELNPRLHSVLADRFARKQVERYKTLVGFKAKHTLAVGERQCHCDRHCVMQGGEATDLSLRPSPQEPSGSARSQFHTSAISKVDDGCLTVGDAAVSPTLFPVGLPLPPVERLPAQFECQFCFEMKKVRRPAEWTRHVHEDVQPFTCTFPHCDEPMSFKRKADWVRHENERHRHLEWWTCTIGDCGRTCFRKDNFQHHLVREHHMTYSKDKRSKRNGAVTNDDDNYISPTAKEEEIFKQQRQMKQLGEMVENCRHVTTKTPTDEACRFCGNVCNSWSKLATHLAHHLVQIALPVLDLVEERQLAFNTEINSPVEQFGLRSSAPGSMASLAQASCFQTKTGGTPEATPSIEQYQYPTISPTGTSALSTSYNTLPVPLQARNNMITTQPVGISAYSNDMSQHRWLDPTSQFGVHGHHSSQAVPMHQNSTTYPPPRLQQIQEYPMSVHQESFTYPPLRRPQADPIGLTILPESLAPGLSSSPTEMNPPTISLSQGPLQNPSSVSFSSFAGATAPEGNDAYQNHIAPQPSYIPAPAPAPTDNTSRYHLGAANVGDEQSAYLARYT